MGLSLTWLLLATLTGLELVLFQQVLITAQASSTLSRRPFKLSLFLGVLYLSMVIWLVAVLSASVHYITTFFNVGLCKPAGGCDKSSSTREWSCR